MLSTCAHSLDRRPDHWPRPTHAGHPCTVWVREGRGNAEWLLAHAEAMDEERRQRRPGTAPHATLLTLKRGGFLSRLLRAAPSGHTPHVNCARRSSLGLDFTWMTDTHAAYRLYLHARWALQCAGDHRQKRVVATVTI